MIQAESKPLLMPFQLMLVICNTELHCQIVEIPPKEMSIRLTLYNGNVEKSDLLWDYLCFNE
jgi:hypothetical protein